MMVQSGKSGLQGWDEFRASLERVKAEVDQAAREAIARAGMLVERTAKHNCPVQTGRLRASIHTVVDLPPGPPRAEVGTDVTYAPYVEFCWRGPAKRDRWFAPIAKTASGRRWLAEHGFSGASGIMVTGDSSKHPPRPYLLPALEANCGKITDLIAAAIRRATGGKR